MLFTFSRFGKINLSFSEIFVNAWKWLIAEYYKTRVVDGFCGMDQDVMAIVAISNKDKVNITQSDDWFTEVPFKLLGQLISPHLFR